MKAFLLISVAVWLCIFDRVEAADGSVNVGIFIVNPARTAHEASGPGVISLDLMRQISAQTNWFVVLKGKTSPYAKVFVLQNNNQVGTVEAGASGEFEAGIHNPKPGTYEWSVYVRDQLGLESARVSFKGEAREGTTVVFEPIIPPPTLFGVMGVSGLVYHIGGSAIPGRGVLVEVKDEQGNIQSKDYDSIAGPDGRWSKTLIISTLPKGVVMVQSSVEVEEGKSVSSFPIEVYFQKDAQSKQGSTPFPSAPIKEKETIQQAIQNRDRIPSLLIQPSAGTFLGQGDGCEGDSCPPSQKDSDESVVSRIVKDISFFVREIVRIIIERVIWFVENIR